jgi:DNA-binding transcriptional LysR family regulator
MNVHHLELFYYVAKHGGISEAVRNIPYGIQQPAVSGQIIQLEEFLGVTLFQRRPFKLTPAGEELNAFIAPFFGQLDAMTAKLQGGTAHQIRIGASEAVLREHLPELLRTISKRFPKLKLGLREANQPALAELLEQGEIDLAVTLVQDACSSGIRSQPLLELPLILLVPKASPLQSSEELWARDRIEEPLIALPPNELVCKVFQGTLAKREIDWFPSIEVNSLSLVETYVQEGYGIGLSTRLPMSQLSEGVRALELKGFPNVVVGAMWRGKASPVAQAFLDEMQKRAKRVASKTTRQD